MVRAMKRLLLLLPTTTYRTDAFVGAALALGVELTVASEEPSAVETLAPERLLTVDFAHPSRAVEQACAFARRYPVHAVFGVDDHTATLAAMIAASLGLPHSPVEAVRAAGDKYLQRCRLREAGVPVPDFGLVELRDDPRAVAARVGYPVVVKPLRLSASRGVIRADGPDECVRAWERLGAIVRAPDVVARGDADSRALIETFVPGAEFALEGIVVEGRLHVLALFDKPDPLDGPVFEETIYVTPSRFPREVQRALADCAARSVAALGLTRGPVHAELRYNDRGPWLIELAARPIGGRCGEALRFGPDGRISLEQLHLAQALGLLEDVPALAPGAHGVMMIPIPRAGILQRIEGVERARAVPGVTDVVVALPVGRRVVPLPEEARYLGFVFGRGDRPEEVERALRAAHRLLRFTIA